MAGVSAGRKFVDGNNIMLFVNDGTSYKSVAHASSHTLSLTAESEDINTKDAGGFAWTEPGVISWEISVDSFYTSDGYELFFDAMLQKEDLKVCFGLKNEPDNSPAVNKDEDGNWTPKSAAVYYGTVTITSLDWTADSGSKSTFSCTLQGKGDLSKTAPQG
jgi:predicted secreted protein